MTTQAPRFFSLALSGLAIVSIATVSVAQMIDPPKTSVTAPTTSAPAGGVPPTAPPTTTTSAVPPPGGDTTVAPVKRVAPKTPPMPSVVAKAIAQSKNKKPAAKGAAKGKVAKGKTGAAVATKACGPGETLVRKTNTCQKKTASAAKPVKTAAVSPTAAKAKKK